MNLFESFSRFPSAQAGAHIFIKRTLLGTNLTTHEKLLHLVVVHGAIEYHRRHELLPLYILEKSSSPILITWIDLVGHGLSGGPRAFVEKFDFFTEDLSQLLSSPVDFKHDNNHIVLDERIESTILIAHSMGGLVSLDLMMSANYSGKEKISGMVLSNPCLKTMKSIPNGLEAVINNLPIALKKIRLPTIYKGIDLTSDEGLATDFDQDVMISKYMTIGLITELMNKGSDIFKRPYYVDCPLLLLLSGEDLLVDAETTKLFSRGIEPKLLTIEEFPEFRHEIFNEKERERAFSKTFEWIQALTML